MIIGQDKEEGTRVLEGGVVELYYAVLIVTYPDFTDPEEEYTQEKIQTFCDDNGINCVFEEIETQNYPSGTILSQNREKGVEVKEGVNLKIEIAKPISNYKVSFDVAGGAPSISSQTVKNGSAAVEPATKPTKTGYTFEGWYLNGSKYSFQTPVTGDITLTAKWSEIETEVEADEE